MSHAKKILARSMVLTAVLASVAGAATATASASPLVLASSARHLVLTADTGTNEYVGNPIELPGIPRSIAITPDARFAYVATEEQNGMSVIELATRRVVGEPIAVGELLDQIAMSPDGADVYAASSSANDVIVIDTLTDRVTAEIALRSAPTGIAITPDGSMAYVIEEEADAVQVLDLQTKKVIGEPIGVKASPQSVAISPDGKFVYVADEGRGLATIDTTTHQVSFIPAGFAGWVTIAPDGRTAWVGDLLSGRALSVINLQTGALIEKIPISEEPGEIAITPDGKFVYANIGGAIHVFDASTYVEASPPIFRAGLYASDLAMTPDQSPTASFSAPTATATVPAAFSGAASTDPDGSVVSWNWAFGDGGIATGVSATHAYGAPGTFGAKLSVIDNEGCGEAEVFTGRTAYCSGGESSVAHPVTVAPAPVAAPPPTPSNRFKFGRLVHNRRNGTVRLQVKLPAAGSLNLAGPQVHMVRKKIGAAGSLWLTVHARVELNKRLKKIHRTTVKVRITFTPTGGTATTTRRSITLLHASRKR
jgi:YVTN family beta-propeller protein